MKLIHIIAAAALVVGIGCSEKTQKIPEGWVRHHSTNKNFSVWSPPDWYRPPEMHSFGNIEINSPPSASEVSGNGITTVSLSRYDQSYSKMTDEFIAGMRSKFSNPPRDVSFRATKEIAGHHASGLPWKGFECITTTGNETNWYWMAVIDGGRKGLLQVIIIAPPSIDEAGKLLTSQIVDSLRVDGNPIIRPPSN